MNENKSPIFSFDRLRQTRLSISVSLLITSIVSVYMAGSVANGLYVDWHDARYAKRSEILTLAQADEIKKEIFEVTERARENRQVLDANAITLNETSSNVAAMRSDMSLYFAIQTVRAQQNDLDSRIRRGNLPNDQADIEKLRHELQDAERYRDCLIQQKNNCEMLRPK